MKIAFDEIHSNHAMYCRENENRVFGMNKLSDDVDEIFSKNKLAFDVCEVYLKEKMVLQTTMSARIDYCETSKYGSGGSWHRDSFSSRIKSFAYLTDMDEQNGPFMYIKGSHKKSDIIKLILNHDRVNGNPSSNRYTDLEMESLIEDLGYEISYFPCPKGTLVLAVIR